MANNTFCKTRIFNWSVKKISGYNPGRGWVAKPSENLHIATFSSL